MPNGIEGLDKLMKKYGELAERTVGNNIVKAVGASAKLVQAEAKTLSPKTRANYGTASSPWWSIGMIWWWGQSTPIKPTPCMLRWEQDLKAQLTTQGYPP